MELVTFPLLACRNLTLNLARGLPSRASRKFGICRLCSTYDVVVAVQT